MGYDGAGLKLLHEALELILSKRAADRAVRGDEHDDGPAHLNLSEEPVVAFHHAVEAIASAARELIDSLETTQEPRDREEEATKAKARSALRFA